MPSLFWKLLRDYLHRTLGVWLILILVQFIFASLSWALSFHQIPLIGMAAVLFASGRYLEPSFALIRLLPITPRAEGLFFWFATVVIPAIAMDLAHVLALLSNITGVAPIPSSYDFFLWLWMPWAALGLLSILTALPRFAFEDYTPLSAFSWLLIVALLLYGIPANRYTLIFSSVGIAQVFILLAQVCFSRTARQWSRADIWYARFKGNQYSTRLFSQKKFAPRTYRHRGWMLAFTMYLRHTLPVIVIATCASFYVNNYFPHLARNAIWAIAIAAVIINNAFTYRWIPAAVHALRYLPIGGLKLLAILQCVTSIPLLIALSAVVYQLDLSIGTKIGLGLASAFFSISLNASMIATWLANTAMQNRISVIIVSCVPAYIPLFSIPRLVLVLYNHGSSFWLSLVALVAFLLASVVLFVSAVIGTNRALRKSARVRGNSFFSASSVTLFDTKKSER